MTPRQILAVFENLKAARPKNNFTIGIEDDVTYLSLPETGQYKSPDGGTISCKFGARFGRDGRSEQICVQNHRRKYGFERSGVFLVRQQKSGGTTVSYLRFGKNKIRAPYLIYEADYIACHNKSFLNHFNLISGIKPGGTFVLNCDFAPEELPQKLPAELKRKLAENNIRFYIINAEKIASEIGLGNRINMIMQSAFFKLTGIIPQSEAARL